MRLYFLTGVVMPIHTKLSYITSDGKEFTDKHAAEKHEDSLTGLNRFYSFERTPHNVITHAQAKEIVQWQLNNDGKSLSGGENLTSWHIGKVEIYELLDFIYGINLKQEAKTPLFK